MEMKEGEDKEEEGTRKERGRNSLSRTFWILMTLEWSLFSTSSLEPFCS